MKSVFFVTTPELQINDRCSFAFLMLVQRDRHPDLYREMGNHFGAWGQVHVKAKGKDHFNPWAWAAGQMGEPHGQIVGDDGIPRVNINVWESGNPNPVLAAGWDLTDLPKTTVMAEHAVDLVQRGTPLLDAVDAALLDSDPFRKIVQELPERCSLLVPRALYDRFEEACKAEGVATHVYHHPNPIASS